MKFLILTLISIFLISCAGMKVVDPNSPEEQNKGTRMLDLSSGELKVVSTYTCKMDSAGNRFSAVGKSEAEAKKEVFARCQDRTMINFCKNQKISCFKN